MENSRGAGAVLFDDGGRPPGMIRIRSRCDLKGIDGPHMVTPVVPMPKSSVLVAAFGISGPVTGGPWQKVETIEVTEESGAPVARLSLTPGTLMIRVSRPFRVKAGEPVNTYILEDAGPITTVKLSFSGGPSITVNGTFVRFGVGDPDDIILT